MLRRADFYAFMKVDSWQCQCMCVDASTHSGWFDILQLRDNPNPVIPKTCLAQGSRFDSGSHCVHVFVFYVDAISIIICPRPHFLSVVCSSVVGAHGDIWRIRSPKAGAPKSPRIRIGKPI